MISLMQFTKIFSRSYAQGFAVAALSWPLCGVSQSDAYRGLWVGQVTLNQVNEVSIPLDENNNPVAPDPNAPTPTSDEAHLRLILHVDGAGRVSLLKDVAILERNPIRVGVNNTEVVDYSALDLNLAGASPPSEANDSDISLVTDERLYGEFPPQPAIRIASAVFDFGESRATDALNTTLDSAVSAFMTSFPNNFTTKTASELETAVAAARSQALSAANNVVSASDVSEAFDDFLTTQLTSTAVNDIADNGAAPAPIVAAATQVQTDSLFFNDSRAVDMVEAVESAATSAEAGFERRDAQNAAATFEDILNKYQRFIAGTSFGSMIDAAAAAGAAAAVLPAADETSIRSEIDSAPVVNDTRAEALEFQINSRYDDTRAAIAVETVIDAVVSAIADALANPPLALEAAIASKAAAAGRLALAEDVDRYRAPAFGPTIDYDDFVASDVFQIAGSAVANAIADAVSFELEINPLATLVSIRAAARIGGSDGLSAAYTEAARALRTELPLVGAFGPGETNLNGVISLPATHPTNPFRHRRHPDHRLGFDITRHVRLDFDGDSGETLSRSGYGVDRITGNYQEEIFGLHKPLGSDPGTNPIGLKTQGVFELNRISLIDSLNAL